MLSGRWSPSFKLTEASDRKKNQSILLMERSSRSVALPSLSGARVSLRGVAFSIKSSMDVIQVPIDTIFLQGSLRVKPTGTSSTVPVNEPEVPPSRRRTANPTADAIHLLMVSTVEQSADTH
jgi:hypothetical protein